MTTPDLVRLFVAPLNALDIPYMVTGAVAAVIHGEPRMTRDVDLVATLAPADTARLAKAFPEPDFYLPPPEVLAAETARPEGGHFNIIHIPSAQKADVYPAARDPFHRWALEHRITRSVAGERVHVAPVEYVIVRKLQWYQSSGSTRHLDDIRAMMRVSGHIVDRETLAGWIERLHLEPTWPTDLLS